jgi:hypothetical protein
MDASIASKSAYSRQRRELRDELPSSEVLTDVAVRLTGRASLMLTLLLSLGLWAAIWAAVASLATAILG